MSISDEDAVKRLRESLARFDDSAINTIHGFCQKMLSEHVFTSAGNFDTELSDDDAALRDEVTESFLRRELDACTSADERRLLMQGDDWAEKAQNAGRPARRSGKARHSRRCRAAAPRMARALHRHRACFAPSSAPGGSRPTTTCSPRCGSRCATMPRAPLWPASGTLTGAC